jgi:Tfp pilus assembly protein FimT
MANPLPSLRRIHPARKSALGFTLIEMLAVVGLMLLLLSLTLPVIRGSSNVTKAAWELSGLIEQARAHAMAQNTYVWIGFNEAQASTTAQKNTAVFLMASKDGSSTATPSNLVHFGKTIILERLTIANFSSSNFDYGNRKGAADGVVQFSLRNAISGGSILPTKLATYTSTKVIRFDPEGSASVTVSTDINTVEMPKWIELGLQPMQGTAVPTKNSDTAALQITGLTGQTRIYRP